MSVDVAFPIHADARSLPFAAEFFDAIQSLRAGVSGRRSIHEKHD